DLQVALVPARDRADRKPEPVDDHRAPRGLRQRVLEGRRVIREGTPVAVETLVAEQIRTELEVIDQVPAGLDRDLQPWLVGECDAELLGWGEIVHGALPVPVSSPCRSTGAGRTQSTGPPRTAHSLGNGTRGTLLEMLHRDVDGDPALDLNRIAKVQ